MQPAADQSACSCGRPAVQWLGDQRTPWCGTNDLPPLPGSRQWLERQRDAEAEKAARAACVVCGQALNPDDPDDPVRDACQIDDPGWREHVTPCHEGHPTGVAVG